MNIAISGATGYIGKHLSAFLSEEYGHRIIPLSRSMFRESMSGYLIQALSHCDVVINLAGAPISKRWTSAYKKELYDSRIHVTRRIVSALSAVKTRPKLMISTSAVGYYPTDGEYDEYSSKRGDDFLAGLCYAWEKEAKLCPAPVRVVIARLGVVLSPDGGAMAQMLKPLKVSKVASVIGPGTQPFPWIDIRDLCRAMAFFIENEATKGIYNLVAPQQITQRALTHSMARAYGAWTTVTVPRFVFRGMYGEAASFLTSGQSVHPTRLLEDGFHFTISKIDKVFNGIDKSTVSILNLSRYMGLWYEIARYDHRFERGLTRVTASYTLLSDNTVRVENTGCKKKASGYISKRAVGRAKIPDPSQPGKLKVSFFLWFYSDYYVLELDEKDYNYALIGSSSDKYLWILSRTPQLPEDIKTKLVNAAEYRGYDTKCLIWVEQCQPPKDSHF